jgi:SAM-dependent methyltransferase
MSMLDLSLDDSTLEALRRCWLGPQGLAVIAHLVALNVNRPSKPEASIVSWCDAQGLTDQGRLTTAGQLVSTSLREYTFWLERGRTTHHSKSHPWLSNDFYRDKEVVEVGSGYGSNLFSIRPVAKRVLGVEPVPIYRQVSPLIAEREGAAPIEIVHGLGEQLPLGDASVDVIVCYSSCQYMDTRRAFAEMARALRSGGQLQVVCGVFDQAMAAILGEFRARPSLGNARHAVEVVINTLCYQHLGRRTLRRHARGTTDAPIYAQEQHQARWMEAAGLRVRRDMTRRVDTDCLMFGEKP